MAITPRTRKGRATRERIVAAAAGLVAEKGVNAVSLDDVQSRAGASRSQLYHYFDNRDDLIRAVIEFTTSAVLGEQGELLQELDSWTGIDRWFDALVALQVKQHAIGGCPLGSLAGQLAETDPIARTQIAVGLDRWQAHLEDGLTRLQTAGQLRPDADPATLATATMASLQGGVLLTQVRRDPHQLRTALNAARDALRIAAA